MAEETQAQETVEEVVNEQVDTQESTEEPKEELVSKEVMKQRIDRKEKQHQKAYSELQESFNLLKDELEEIKLNSLPEKERKGYKQEQEEKKQQQRLADIEAREKAIQTKEAAIQTKQELSEADIDSRFTDILLDTGVYESTEDKIAAFKDLYAEVRANDRKNDVKDALRGRSPKMNNSNNNEPIKFSDLSYTEKVELKTTDPEKYKLLKEND
jgi:hypothetical protein